MDNDIKIQALSDLFKVLGDPTRLKILYFLFESELCVCDIAEKMKMNQPAISQQLKILRQANILQIRRDGRHLYYSLVNDDIKKVFEMGNSNINKKEV